MRYSITFRLRGAPSAAVAVEWTEAPAPQDSGAGWEPCVRLQDGDWRIFSYGALEGRAQHWRSPGPIGNIGLRYRLVPGGPWSPVSVGRKEIDIVAVAPAALRAAEWAALAPAASGVVALLGGAAGAVAVEWTRADGTGEVWQACEALGDGRWTVVAAGLAGVPVALRYRLEVDGPWSSASEDAKVLVPGEEVGAALPPLMLAAPALAGAGWIGSAIVASPGIWTGQPALALQWRRDGEAIPGAEGPEYVPGPADDEAALTCAVTASNPAGLVTVATAAMVITYAPPTARGELFEEVFDEGTGWQEVDAAVDFTGDNLRFSVEGAGATVDADSGLVRIPTDAPVSGETITVTAVNSGGSAASAFMVTVEAAETGEAERPPAAALGDWGLVAVALEPGKHTGVFTLSPALGAVEVQWLGVNIDGYASEAELEPHYNPTVALPDNAWRHASPEGKSVHLRQDGTVLNHIRMRYRTAADGPWSPPSLDRRRLDATLLPAIEPPTLPAEGHWGTLPFRTAAEAAQGLRGGCQEQFWHGSARSKSNPNLIIAGQDTGGTWYSEDDGVNWHHSEDNALVTFGMQGVAIDPANANVWFGVGSENSYAELSAMAGIYKSVDRGRSWVRKLTLDGVHHQRVPHNICHDPTTESQPIGSRIWYAPVHYRNNANGRIYRSADGGETWSLRSSIPVSASGAAVQGHITTVWHHPSQTNVVFLCTQVGLWKSTDGAASWTRMGGVGGLPIGEVLVLEINPNDGNEIYAVINKQGSTPGTLWRTVNGGAAWSQVTTPGSFTASKIYVGMTNGAWPAVGSRTLYLVGRGGNSGPDGRLRVSHNGGATWFVADVKGRPGDLGETAWANNVSDSAGSGSRPELCARILPHPTNPLKAVAHAKAHIFRTEDRGVTWRYSGEGFTGLIWGNYSSGVSFTEDPNRFGFGCTDTGLMLTRDGGHSFWHTRPHKAPDPAGGSLKDSMHVVALHPTDPNLVVASCGFNTSGANTYLFRSTVASPRTFASGDWKRVTDTNSASTFLHWHRTDPRLVYSADRRSVNAGATFAGYPSSLGRVCAAWRADNNVIYGIDGRGTDTVIRWSENQGTTSSAFVNVGWSVVDGDVRRTVIAVHPTNRNIIFTRSASGDLARYDRATNSWKTDYGLVGMTRAANPGIPASFAVSVASVAIDPQDPGCVYVSMRAPGYQTLWRTQNGQGAAPVWENITYNLFRVSRGIVAVHPHTGDVFFGANGIGAARVIPAPGPRSHPSIYPRLPF